MEAKFNSSQRIGDIVAEFPNASEVFKAFQIDFCCGGARPLKEAIAEQKLDEQQVLTALNQAYQEIQTLSRETKDWREASSTELIDHILNTHHVYMHTTLPAISELVTTILRVHGGTHPELARVHKLFHSLKAELEQHLIKEEEILFPLIKQYEKDSSAVALEQVRTVMQETEDEHDGAGDIIKELREITNGFQAPADGCTTYWLAFQKLEELEGDLFQHIHLENNILFQRF